MELWKVILLMIGAIAFTYKDCKGPGLPPVDWDQWDELRNKRRLEALTPGEEDEYQHLTRVVAVIDAASGL